MSKGVLNLIAQRRRGWGVAQRGTSLWYLSVQPVEAGRETRGALVPKEFPAQPKHTVDSGKCHGKSSRAEHHSREELRVSSCPVSGPHFSCPSDRPGERERDREREAETLPVSTCQSHEHINTGERTLPRTFTERVVSPPSPHTRHPGEQGERGRRADRTSGKTSLHPGPQNAF